MNTLQQMHEKEVVECNTAKRKEEVLKFLTTWIELEVTLLSKLSQKGKDKYSVILFLCSKKRNSQETSFTKFVI